MAATLVLLPGLDGTDVFLRPLAAALSPTFQTVIVCYPDAGPQDYGELLQVIRRATDELDEFYVLGLSFSGPLAVMLAASRPARVKGLVLVATFLRAPRRRLAALGALCVGPVLWSWRFLRRLPLWLLEPPDDPVRRAKDETWRRVSARCLARRVRALLRVDVRPQLRSCRQPVLCIAFDRDGMVPRRNVADILREAPTATSVVVPGGHFSGCMNVEALDVEITGFIARSSRVPVGSSGAR